MGAVLAKEEEEKKEEEKKEEKGIIRSATVYLSPWDNQQRNLNIENLEVDEGEEYESAIFDVNICLLPEEDADTKTKGKANITQQPKPVLLNNQKPTEEVAILDYNGYVKLCFPLEISRKFIIFTIHQRIRGKWTKTEIGKQYGGYKVEANISDFDVDAIFCTSRQMHEEITVPPDGFLYRSNFAKEQEIRFPIGSVAANTHMKISTLAVDQDCKKSKIEKKLPGSGIQSLSNIVYIHHSQPFTKNVTVKLKLDHLFDTEENSRPSVFHCDESGLHILHDVPVRRISGDVYEVDVQKFSGVLMALGDTQIPESGRVSAVSNAFGLDFDYCNILIFLHRDVRFHYLWSEIVLEADREEREKKRTKEGLFELPKCRSPTIKLKNLDRIRVTVGPNRIMRVSRDVPAHHCFIYYNKYGTDNHLNIPVVRDVSMGQDDMAVIQFNMDSKSKTLLHTAYFNTAEYTYLKVPGPKRLKEPGGPTSFPTTKVIKDNGSTLTDNSDTEFFSDKSLCALSRNISPKSIRQLALQLGITMTTIEDLHEQYGSDIGIFKLQLLLKWRGRGKINPTEKLKELVCALEETDLNSLAEVAAHVYSENRYMKGDDFK